MIRSFPFDGLFSNLLSWSWDVFCFRIYFANSWINCLVSDCLLKFEELMNRHFWFYVSLLTVMDWWLDLFSFAVCFSILGLQFAKENLKPTISNQSFCNLKNETSNEKELFINLKNKNRPSIVQVWTLKKISRFCAAKGPGRRERQRQEASRRLKELFNPVRRMSRGECIEAGSASR
jgi:hypothetical protein